MTFASNQVYDMCNEMACSIISSRLNCHVLRRVDFSPESIRRKHSLNIFIISFVKRQDLKKSQIRRIKISFWLHSVTLPLNSSYFPGVFPLCVVTWPMLGSVRFNTPTTGDLGISRATTCCVSNAVYCTHGNSDLIEETALFQFHHSFTYRNSMLIFTPDFFPKTFL